MAVVLRQFLAMAGPSERTDLANRKDQYGWAPLHRLCSGGKDHTQAARGGMVAQLCQAKADVEVIKKKGATPLMVAAATSQFEQVVALMENGADPNNCDAEGATVLDMAWNNRAMQKTLTDTAARIGAGVSGSGRQRAYTCIYTDACGEKPALWWARLYGEMHALM